MFNTYWGGYFNSPKQTLDKCPKYINNVILAFIGPLQNSQVETTFLCSKYPKGIIQGWIKKVQANGTKVMMSILDTPNMHWDSVNFEIFEESLRNVMNEWNIDGFDIDAESGMETNYVESFVKLVNCVRSVVDNKQVSYTCYTCSEEDSQILTETTGKIDFVQTMGYFEGYSEMIATYDYYKRFNKNVLIGVKAGTLSDSGTPLIEVKQLCKFKGKAGMMLWTFNRDNKVYTNQKMWKWTQTIYSNL